MKKTAVLLLAAALAAVSCSSKRVEGTKLAAGTPAYQLAKDIAALAPQYDPDKNAVLITAKGFTVTAGDVVEVIHGTMGNGAAQLKTMPAEQLKTALGRAAVQVGERKLLLAAAAKAGMVVTPEEIQAVMESQYAGAGGEAAFQEALKSNNVDVAFVKKMMGDDKLIQKYFEDKVFAAIKIGDEDLRKAYAEDKTATVRHILLLTQGKTDDQKKEIRTRMEGLLERVKKGEDFAALAAEMSEDTGSKDKGGLIEDFPRGQMVKPFEDASFTVPVGQISDIVETAYGYHIVKVESRKKETAPFDEVKAQLTESLKGQRQQAAYEKLLADLKAEAKFKEVKAADAKPAEPAK